MLFHIGLRPRAACITGSGASGGAQANATFWCSDGAGVVGQAGGSPNWCTTGTGPDNTASATNPCSSGAGDVSSTERCITGPEAVAVCTTGGGVT